MARTLIASDNFNRASLGADWAQLNAGNAGDIVIDGSTRIRGSFGNQNVDDKATARWVGAGTFSDDQYSSLVLVNPVIFNGTTVRIGVIARASADTGAGRDYYEAYLLMDSGTTPTTRLVKWVNGTRTQLHSAAVAWAANDRIDLECEGSEIRVCKNGTPLGGSFTQTDTSITTGKPGVTATNSTFGDSWEGGDIAADAVPPTLTDQELAATGGTTATATVSTSETGGTMYVVVTTSATAPTVAQVKAGQNHLGAAATFSTSAAVSSVGLQTFSATGLSTTTTYYAHFVHTDASANDSSVATSAAATTDNPGTGGGEIGDTDGGGAQPASTGADTAGKGRRKRLYLGPKPGPAPQPPAPAVQPAQPAPQLAEPYTPRLPGVLQGLLDVMPAPVFEPAAQIQSAPAQDERLADDDHAALIAAEMLLA